MKRTPSSSKFIEQQLHVHVDLASGVHHVGRLSVDESTPGQFVAEFEYSPQWLQNPEGFALDPLNLPRKEGVFRTDNKYIRLGVLFDAAPDLWGRRVLKATGESTELEGDILLKGRGNGVGCLLFATQPGLSRTDLPGLDTLPIVEEDLERVHEAVHQVHGATPEHQRIQELLGGSWSMGGARAKAVMRDKAGGIWLAKFSEPGDRFDRQRIEMANLLMAKEIGLPVSDSCILDTRLGSVFLTKRFDRTAALDRRHYISAISLVSAVPQSKRLDTVHDRAIFSYARLSDIISRISANPVQERKSIFARMLLNVCLRNTDDHLKNFGFVLNDDLRTFSLSPVFDVVTQAQPQHYLRIGAYGREGSIENALSEPRAFGLTAAGARDIANLVVDVTDRRNEFYERVGLPAADVQMLGDLLGRGPIQDARERLSLG